MAKLANAPARESDSPAREASVWDVQPSPEKNRFFPWIKQRLTSIHRSNTEPPPDLTLPASKRGEPPSEPTSNPSNTSTTAPEIDCKGKETNKERYEVEAIRGEDPNSKEFLVKWKGYTTEEMTWEPAALMEKDVPEAVTAWRRANGEVFNIEAIVKQDRKRDRYFVKWLGYPDTVSTWEPGKSIRAQAPAAVAEWKIQNTRKRKKR